MCDTMNNTEEIECTCEPIKGPNQAFKMVLFALRRLAPEGGTLKQIRSYILAHQDIHITEAQLTVCIKLALCKGIHTGFLRRRLCDGKYYIAAVSTGRCKRGYPVCLQHLPPCSKPPSCPKPPPCPKPCPAKKPPCPVCPPKPPPCPPKRPPCPCPPKRPPCPCPPKRPPCPPIPPPCPPKRPPCPPKKPPCPPKRPRCPPVPPPCPPKSPSSPPKCPCCPPRPPCCPPKRPRCPPKPPLCPPKCPPRPPRCPPRPPRCPVCPPNVPPQPPKCMSCPLPSGPSCKCSACPKPQRPVPANSKAQNCQLKTKVRSQSQANKISCKESDEDEDEDEEDEEWEDDDADKSDAMDVDEIVLGMETSEDGEETSEQEMSRGDHNDNGIDCKARELSAFSLTTESGYRTQPNGKTGNGCYESKTSGTTTTSASCSNRPVSKGYFSNHKIFHLADDSETSSTSKSKSFSSKSVVVNNFQIRKMIDRANATTASCNDSTESSSLTEVSTDYSISKFQINENQTDTDEGNNPNGKNGKVCSHKEKLENMETKGDANGSKKKSQETKPAGQRNKDNKKSISEKGYSCSIQ